MKKIFARNHAGSKEGISSLDDSKNFFARNHQGRERGGEPFDWSILLK